MASIKHKRITGKPRTSMAATFRKRYNNGASIRSIAQSSGRSYGFVHKTLLESGANMRGRGGDMRKNKRAPGRG